MPVKCEHSASSRAAPSDRSLSIRSSRLSTDIAHNQKFNDGDLRAPMNEALSVSDTALPLLGRPCLSPMIQNGGDERTPTTLMVTANPIRGEGRERCGRALGALDHGAVALEAISRDQREREMLAAWRGRWWITADVSAFDRLGGASLW